VFGFYQNSLEFLDYLKNCLISEVFSTARNVDVRRNPFGFTVTFSCQITAELSEHN
jgi:hypothetical protein